MEFNQKIQELRKQKGLTQEELAQALYVSRTAISKWESGRGYPNIDSLKMMARFFSVTVDDLLSGDQLLTLAEQDQQQKTDRVRDLVFGLLDPAMAVLFFLPFFGQPSNGTIKAVSLLSLTEISPYLKYVYFAFVICTVAVGILTLALQSLSFPLWVRSKRIISLGFSVAGTLLFIVSSQPYAAVFVFVFLAIKSLMLIK